ncbi:MAG: glycosyltransferase [Hafnia sp.]
MTKKKKLCIVATVPVALRVFMLEHIRELSKYYDVTLMVNGESHDMEGLFDEQVRFIPLPIQRKISLLSDLGALWRLSRIFAVEKFDCVFSIMPKSGLLSMVASYLVRVPQRFHMFTGQVWYTKTGVARVGLKMLDKLLAFCATHVLADSPSQRDFLIEEYVVRANKITVLGKGSISGVDIDRFKPDANARAKYRSELGIDNQAVVFLFMARLTRIKGVIDLARAFRSVAHEMPRAHLLVIGPDEDGLDEELKSLLLDFQSRFHRIGFTYDPEGYMAASDVFCIPSYREGFSSATIQAAGVGLPAIASRIYGLSDAVEENVSGVFHDPGDLDEISAALVRLYNDDALRKQLSGQACQRAHSEFSQAVIVKEMAEFIHAAVR